MSVILQSWQDTDWRRNRMIRITLWIFRTVLKVLQVSPVYPVYHGSHS